MAKSWLMERENCCTDLFGANGAIRIDECTVVLDP